MLTLLRAQGLASVLLLSCYASHFTLNGTDRAPVESKTFPDDFMFGAATAAYQIEGAWNVSGKSPNIWDAFTHKAGSSKENGDNACKSFYYYKCDSEMLRYLGANLYRFSISWARILPDGFSNYVNQQGIDHYNEIIDDLLMNDIEPVVTINHFDIPQCLQDLGGWANPDAAQWIEDYARVLFESFGDRVKIWITINEPKMATMGYGSGMIAPGLAQGHGTAEYTAAKNVVLGHARIWHLYDKEFRKTQKGKVGITIATDFAEALTDTADDIQAAQDAFDFNVGIFAHPIFSSSGGFPPRVTQLVAEKSIQQGYPRSRLPDFTEEERNFCKGASDFYGFNHYSTQYWTRSTYKPGKDIPSMNDDLGAKGSFLNYPKTASAHIAVIPHGIRRALKLVKDLYNNPEILITENGVATKEDLQDIQRIDYFKKYMGNILDAIYEDQVNVKGYLVWSLMDNYEFVEGYKVKFGIFKVNFEDEYRKRQARLSAIWYRQLISSRTLDPGYMPKFEEAEFCVA